MEGVCSLGKLAVGMVTLGRRGCCVVEEELEVVRAGGGRDAPFCPWPASTVYIPKVTKPVRRVFLWMIIVSGTHSQNCMVYSVLSVTFPS